MAKFGMKILLKKLPNFGTVKFGNIRQISHHLALAYVENFHGLREGSFTQLRMVTMVSFVFGVRYL